MILEIKGVTKKYGKMYALDKFDLKIENGIYGILGHNGAGKSTLMGVLTNNIKADAGEITVDGNNIRELKEKYRAMVGYMPQEQVCYPQFTAREFLSYMALIKGMKVKEKETQRQIDEMLEVVHLSNVQNNRISTFSGGMKRRIILAQAFLGNPKIVILDEPTAGMDPGERIAIRNLIADQANDRIVILSTHIASDIECIANKVVIMKNGHIIANGSQEELLNETAKHVKEIMIPTEGIHELDDANKKYNIYQKNGKMIAHVISGVEVEKCTDVSLDDVFLYYSFK